MNEKVLSEVVLKVPVGLLKTVVGHAASVEDAAVLLQCLASPWAVIYRKADEKDTTLQIAAFETQESLEEWLAKQYTVDMSIEVVLHYGQPKKFQMTVRARIHR